MNKPYIATMVSLLSLAIFMETPSVFALTLEAPYAETTSKLPKLDIPSKFHFVDAGWAWQDAEKGVIREALREWDVRICNTTVFIEDLVSGFSFDWAGDTVFNNSWGTDYSDALALYVPTGARNVPAGVSTNEIYFNVKYMWYVDSNPLTDNDKEDAGFYKSLTSYDLLSVAKHEIGHLLGLSGDYKDPKRKSEVMYFSFAAGERRHQTEKDFDELRSLGYYTVHAVPEPATLLLLGTGIAGLAAFRRRKRK